MKLLLRRDQKSGLTGKTTFILTARAELTPEEQTLLDKYKLGNLLLVHHEKAEGGDGSGSLGSITKNLYKMMKDTAMTADKLVTGTTFDCKDIAEMMDIEAQVRESAMVLRSYLEASKYFGGEEVIDIDKIAQEEATV